MQPAEEQWLIRQSHPQIDRHEYFNLRIAKQGYHKAGAHSAAKMCKYAKDSILKKGACYKNKFYGISSHRCLQCSPVLQFCNLSCKFCWRLIPEVKEGWLKMPPSFEWDSPEFIADALIAEQKRIMSGFLGNEKADASLAKEAMEPNQVALSLIGEPAMYPHLGKLLEIFHKKKMTTFLVTNGTFPKALERLKPLPTQLYISLIAPDEKTHAYVAQQSENAEKLIWKNYLSSLDFLKKAGEKTRTVLRMTLTRGLNDNNLPGYAELIKRAMPHYVEVKSMVYVGGARNSSRGLQLSDMLSVPEIEAIAEQLSDLTGYIVVDTHAPSRVTLLARDKNCAAKRFLCKTK